MMESGEVEGLLSPFTAVAPAFLLRVNASLDVEIDKDM